MEDPNYKRKRIMEDIHIYDPIENPTEWARSWEDYDEFFKDKKPHTWYKKEIEDALNEIQRTRGINSGKKSTRE